MTHGRAEEGGRSIEFPRFTFHDVTGIYVTGGMSAGRPPIGGDDGHATAVEWQGEGGVESPEYSSGTGMFCGGSGIDGTGRLEWIRLHYTRHGVWGLVPSMKLVPVRVPDPVDPVDRQDRCRDYVQCRHLPILQQRRSKDERRVQAIDEFRLKR